VFATNSALYLGVVCAHILDECPDAELVTRRNGDALPIGYTIQAMRRRSDGSRVGQSHTWLDIECDQIRDWIEVARGVGTGIGRNLRSAT
jgi:hypothetical protein